MNKHPRRFEGSEKRWKKCEDAESGRREGIDWAIGDRKEGSAVDNPPKGLGNKENVAGVCAGAEPGAS